MGLKTSQVFGHGWSNIISTDQKIVKTISRSDDDDPILKRKKEERKKGIKFQDKPVRAETGKEEARFAREPSLAVVPGRRAFKQCR